MADPVSISGLILAVLHSVGTISSLIGDIRNVPYQVRFLRSDLEALKPALDQLSEIIDRPGQNEISLENNLSPALQQCQEASILFQESLSHWTKRLVDGKLAWIDRVNIATRHQGQIDAFQKQLAACKQSLILSITTTHLSQSQPKTSTPRDDYFWSQVEVLERNATETGNYFSTDMTRTDGHIRDLTLSRPADNGSTSQDLPDNAIRQLQLYKKATEHFYRLCSESIPKTVTELKQQKIRNVKTSADSVAHVGIFNEREGADKINQDMSDVTTDNKSFAVLVFGRFGEAKGEGDEIMYLARCAGK
ncbi:hypothetical protein PG985_001579 [Apiospora marii]|uniref:Azaphilone pigments biosynthesis cluster protein L N-terminal domain-containing protein n=1 Tax=Apiospora marii TaxID=335849 RepID=A0ABR1RIC3_9PEZI